MNEYFPVPGIESFPLDQVEESLVTLRASEDELAISFGAWINKRNDKELEEAKEAAINASQVSFAAMADLIIDDSSYEFADKMNRLRMVYLEVAELRRDRFIELLPGTNPNSILNQHSLQNFMGRFLENRSTGEMLHFISDKYAYDLYNCMEYITAARDGRTPRYMSIHLYSEKFKQINEKPPVQKRLGGKSIAAAFGLGLATGLIFLKNH